MLLQMQEACSSSHNQQARRRKEKNPGRVLLSITASRGRILVFAPPWHWRIVNAPRKLRAVLKGKSGEPCFPQLKRVHRLVDLIELLTGLGRTGLQPAAAGAAASG